MGKRKRPTNHALSQEEIWDDSALIRSWDEAVAEYQFYHSIAARGEDVEEVLRLAELEGDGGAVTNGSLGTKAHPDAGKRIETGNGDVMDEEIEDGEVDEDEDLDIASTAIDGEGAGKGGMIGPQLPTARSTSTDGAELQGQRKAATTTLVSESETFAEASQATSSGQDQVLENIKMAYWWAGYYSGLYEGQQQVAGTTTK